MSVPPELRRLGAYSPEGFKQAKADAEARKLKQEFVVHKVELVPQNPVVRSCSPAWGNEPNGCKFFGADPDGDYCGHPKSLAITGFGLSTNAMGREGLCNFGKRELWEPKDA